MSGSTDGTPLFREQWVTRQRAPSGAVELARPARWTGLLWSALLAATLAGVLACVLVRVHGSLSLPARVEGTNLVAPLAGYAGPPPAPDAPVLFRPEGRGPDVEGRLTAVDAGGLRAQLVAQPPRSTGTVIVSTGDQRLGDLLLPQLSGAPG